VENKIILDSEKDNFIIQYFILIFKYKMVCMGVCKCFYFIDVKLSKEKP
jgi:hypothetical protein